MARRGRPPVGPAGDDGSPRRLDPREERALAAEIARDYYLDDLTMVGIGQRRGLTRFQVARLLQLAKQSGIVTITIDAGDAGDPELGRRLEESLGVERVVVVRDAVAVVDEVGAALAHLVEETVHENDVVGFTWSRTIVAMARHVRTLPQCTTVQLAGHLASSVTDDTTVEVVRQLADTAHGRAYPIYAPMIAPDSYVARSLAEQPGTATTFELFDRLNVAVVAIGGWGPRASTVYDSIDDDARDFADRLGVVGEVSGRLFDGRGELVPDPIDARVIGITLDQLRRTPSVIACAHGAERVAAVRAAVGSIPFCALVVDEPLALALLG